MEASCDAHVLGHVPKSLNSREAEFEGLLHGNNSSTKIISLGCDGPVKRDVTHPEGGTSGPSQTLVSKCTRPEDISSPMFVAPQEGSTPQPRASTPLAPAGGTTKRCFHLPTGLPLTPNARMSGLTPSQAEDIEFETCLASYSDDELNSLNTSS